MLSTVTGLNPFSKKSFRAALRMAALRLSFSLFLLSASPKMKLLCHEGQSSLCGTDTEVIPAVEPEGIPHFDFLRTSCW
jgi:hypothetical protein